MDRSTYPHTATDARPARGSDSGGTTHIHTDWLQFTALYIPIYPARDTGLHIWCHTRTAGHRDAGCTHARHLSHTFSPHLIHTRAHTAHTRTARTLPPPPSAWRTPPATRDACRCAFTPVIAPPRARAPHISYHGGSAPHAYACTALPLPSTHTSRLCPPPSAALGYRRTLLYHNTHYCCALTTTTTPLRLDAQLLPAPVTRHLPTATCLHCTRAPARCACAADRHLQHYAAPCRCATASPLFCPPRLRTGDRVLLPSPHLSLRCPRALCS